MSDTQIIQEKLNQAARILEEFDVGVWLTFVRETSMQSDPVLELILGTDVTWSSAFLLQPSGRHTAIIGHFDAENVRRLGLYDQVITYHHGMGDLMRSALHGLNPAGSGPSTIAINYSETDKAADGLTYGMYLALKKILQGTPHAERLISAERIIGALRGRKSPAEIERVRQAIGVTETLFEEVQQFVRPGMTQAQIAAFVHDRIDAQQLGYAWPKVYNPIVTCGSYSPIGHAAPGEVVLEKGHTLHLDLGVRLNGYCSEYMHAFGHQLGRSAHDGTTVLGPRWERYAGVCELLVETGNIFTLELHVEIPRRGIMSLEEDVLVTDGGVEYLSRPQHELRYIG